MTDTIPKSEAISQIVGGISCILLSLLYNLLYFFYIRHVTYKYDAIENVTTNPKFYFGLLRINSCTIPIKETETTESKGDTTEGVTKGAPVSETIKATTYGKCNQLTQEEVKNYRIHGGGEVLGISKDQNVDLRTITKTFTLHPTDKNYNFTFVLPMLSILVLILSWLVLGSGILLLYSALSHHFN